MKQQQQQPQQKNIFIIKRKITKQRKKYLTALI